MFSQIYYFYHHLQTFSNRIFSRFKVACTTAECTTDKRLNKKLRSQRCWRWTIYVLDSLSGSLHAGFRWLRILIWLVLFLKITVRPNKILLVTSRQPKQKTKKFNKFWCLKELMFLSSFDLFIYLRHKFLFNTLFLLLVFPFSSSSPSVCEENLWFLLLLWLLCLATMRYHIPYS